MPMKVCRRCGREKDSELFNANKGMRDGRTKICKSCNAEAQRARNLAAGEEGKRKARLRYYSFDDEQRRVHQAKARASTAKLSVAERSAQAKASRNRYPERRKARVIVGHALRDGKLQRAPCEVCGATQRIHAHHDDYSKPLEVRWLCTVCHGLHHRKGA